MRACLALMMGAAAWHKLADPARFRAAVAAYDLLPAALVPAAAALVPAAEVALAVAIAADVDSAGLLLAGLLLVYAAAIGWNVRRGRTDLDCGCSGPASPTPVSGALVVRNVALAASALGLALPVSPRALGLLDLFVAVTATLALAALWSAATRVAALAPRAAQLGRRRRGA